MIAKSSIAKHSQRCRVVTLMLLWIAAGHVESAVSQEYPSGVQITKDETAVLAEDYASLPVSASRKEAGSYPPPIDYSTQLARATSLHSEPASASLADKRFFVVDQNGILYISTRAPENSLLTLIWAESIRDLSANHPSEWAYIVARSMRICQEREILHGSHRESEHEWFAPA